MRHVLRIVLTLATMAMWCNAASSATPSEGKTTSTISRAIPKQGEPLESKIEWTTNTLLAAGFSRIEKSDWFERKNSPLKELREVLAIPEDVVGFHGSSYPMENNVHYVVKNGAIFRLEVADGKNVDAETPIQVRTRLIKEPRTTIRPKDSDLKNAGFKTSGSPPGVYYTHEGIEIGKVMDLFYFDERCLKLPINAGPDGRYFVAGLQPGFFEIKFLEAERVAKGTKSKVAVKVNLGGKPWNPIPPSPKVPLPPPSGMRNP